MRYRLIAFGLLGASLAQASTFGAVPPVRHGAPVAQTTWVANAGQWHRDAAFRADAALGPIWVSRTGEVVYQAVDAQASWAVVERVGDGDGRVRSGRATTGRSTYFASDEERHARHFESVWVDGLYPRMRMELRAADRTVEKLLHFDAHAAPQDLWLGFRGAQALSIGADGALQVASGGADLRFSKPVAFQQIDGRRVAVEVAYAVDPERQRYRFELGHYRRGHPLVIDPFVQSTYVGAGGTDAIQGMRVAANGEVIVAGETSSSDFPGIAGGAVPVYPAGIDRPQTMLFVARYSGDLRTRLQATYYGSSNIPTAHSFRGLAIQPDGSIVLAGGTAQGVLGAPTIPLPGMAGGFQPISPIPSTGTGTAGFLVRFSADLTVLRQATFFGADATYLFGVESDASGNVYFGGHTISRHFPGLGNGVDVLNAVFAARLNATLTGGYAVNILAHDGTNFRPVLFRGSFARNAVTGDLYVGGEQGGGPGDPQNGLFVTRFPGNLGPPLASARLSSPTTGIRPGYGNNALFHTWGGLAISPVSNDVVLVGTSAATNVPVTPGVLQTANAGLNDGVIWRLNAALSQQTVSYFGGGGQDVLFDAMFHPNGDLYVGGAVLSGTPGSAVLPAQPVGAIASSPGCVNSTEGCGFVARIAPTLTQARATTLLNATEGRFSQNALARAPGGDVYVAGSARHNGPSMPALAGGAQVALGAFEEGFITRITADLAGDSIFANGFE